MYREDGERMQPGARMGERGVGGRRRGRSDSNSDQGPDLDLHEATGEASKSREELNENP